MDIKQCPFCGYTDNFHLNETVDTDDGSSEFQIECPNCGASSGWMTKVREAVAAWNRRVTNEKPQT